MKNSINNIPLKLLLAAYSISIFSQGILSPIYAFFVLNIGGGVLETAYSMALFSILTGIITILIYKTTWSHIYRKEFLVWGWFLWMISLLMYCCMSTITALCISQILCALGSAFSTSAFDAEYSESASHNLAFGWALFEGFTNIASGVATLLAGMLAAHYGLQFLMLCMAIFATASFGIIFYYSYIFKRKT
jgi:predicted MFS family arabinose efflux permease